MTTREIYAYGLMTGMSLSECSLTEPGFILDMFSIRQKYIGNLIGGGKKKKKDDD